MINDKLTIVSISRKTKLAWRGRDESDSGATSTVGDTLLVSDIAEVGMSLLVAKTIVETLLVGCTQNVGKEERVAAPVMVAAADGSWGVQDTAGTFAGSRRAEGSALPKQASPNSGNMPHSNCSGHFSPAYVNHGRQLFLTSQHRFWHGGRTNTVDISGSAKHGGT